MPGHCRGVYSERIIMPNEHRLLSRDPADADADTE